MTMEQRVRRLLRLAATNGVEDYVKLIDAVAAIKKEAAEYMENAAPMLDDFCFSGDLAAAFDWAYTPQGDTYWGVIHRRL